MTFASTRWQSLLIFIGGLVIFTIGLGQQREIVGFESRFYLFALEMWRHGPTWFPTTYQHPYPDYPVTSTFLIYAFSKLVGHINKFTAVFPSACASAFTLVVTYWLGALYSKRWGLVAVLFLLFTLTFLTEARSISLDQYVTAITALCFYLIYSGELLNRPHRVIWIFPLVVLGFLFRGPIGLVIPSGVVCMFYLLEKDFKRFIWVGIICAMLLVVCSALLYWLAMHVGGAVFAKDVLQMEVASRIHDVRSLPFYFYFQESFGAYAVTYPLAIMVLITVSHKLNTDEKTHLLFQLIGWALIILIGLSIPADKKIRYILPMVPALAIISGYIFYAAHEIKYLTILRSMFVWFCFYFPLLCVVALLAIWYRFPGLELPFKSALAFLIVTQIVMFWALKRSLVIFSLAVLVFVSGFIFIIEPANELLNRAHDFVTQLEKSRGLDKAKLVFYREDMDGWVIKYLVNMPQEQEPIFIKNSQDLLKLQGPAYILTRSENAAIVPAGMNKLTENWVGRERVSVYRK